MKLGFSIGIRTFAFLTALMGCSSLPLKREPASPAVFFPQEACATIQEHYILPLEKFLAAKNVWPSIPFDKVGFVFRDESNDRHWLYGYSPNELSRLQIPFKICAENQKVLIVEPKIPFFKEDSVFTYGFPAGWAPFPTEWKPLYLPVHPLVRSTNRMFFGLRLPLVNPALKPRSKAWDWKEESAKVSSVMIHEIFHGLQFRRFKGFFRYGFTDADYDFSACFTDPNFRSALQGELQDWNHYFFHPEESLDSKKIRILARRILGRRVESKKVGSEIAECWERVAFYERVEGTADYFQTKMMEAAGLKTFSSDWRLKPFPLDSASWESFFYFTGNAFSRILDALDPGKNWQRDVQDGLSLERALEKALKAK